MSFGGLNLGLSLGAGIASPIIRAVSVPQLAAGDILVGDAANDMDNYATYIDTDNYISVFGSIASVVATEIIDGMPSASGTVNTALANEQTIAVRFVVTDSSSNVRTFLTFTRTVIPDVAPTTAGASSDLDTELAGLQVDVETVVDLRDIIYSPGGYDVTYAVNDVGAIDGDGFTWRWTPTFEEWELYGNGNVDIVITCTDEYDQVGTAEWLDGSIAFANDAPAYTSGSLTFVVPAGLGLTNDALLIEAGDNLLLESGDNLLLE